MTDEGIIMRLGEEVTDEGIDVVVDQHEAIQIEVFFLRKTHRHCYRMLREIGLRLVELKGWSGVGWVLTAQKGDGLRVSAHIERQAVLNAYHGEGDLFECSAALFVEKLVEELESIVRPKEEKLPEGIVKSPTGIALDMGEGLRHALGSRWDDLKEMVEGKEHEDE